MQKEVRIGELGGQITTYALDNGQTAQDLANMANISTEGKNFRVGGSVVEASYVPRDGELVLVVKDSKGGQ